MSRLNGSLNMAFFNDWYQRSLVVRKAMRHGTMMLAHGIVNMATQLKA